MQKFEVRVARDRDLQIGDPLTWFYPSSEWVMEQSFDCNCGAAQCYGRIAGASHLSKMERERYWLNQHVVDRMNGEKRHW